MVEKPGHAVPLLQGLREHDVEAGIDLGRGLVISGGRGRGALNEQILGQKLYEGFLDPGSHLVGGGCPEIHI